MVSEEASRFGSSLFTKDLISVLHIVSAKLVVVLCVSVYTTVLHTFLSALACTSIVYSKELERDVTTTATAQALLRLKTLAPFLHRTLSVRFFTSEGRIRAVMYMPYVKCACSELKLANTCRLSSF